LTHALLWSENYPIRIQKYADLFGNLQELLSTKGEIWRRLGDIGAI
jgi:hypothetical protein